MKNLSVIATTIKSVYIDNRITHSYFIQQFIVRITFDRNTRDFLHYKIDYDYDKLSAEYNSKPIKYKNNIPIPKGTDTK